ncbi:hypothetical protein C1645_747064 [Glomus cerebriforme]|uniref:HMG box domain-containing protein n=1 Tax=Glomus cerebriforme TaxID=658196 RepID=A0A397TNQ7_9GLOM|nr:hypothetical protein C1645_747064 [Glomus cerebriforme]
MNKIMNLKDITVPFPPQIKPEDILEKRRQNRKSAKSPNAFFIYRIAYLDQLRLNNFRVKMTDMSGMVSTSWKKEPSNVKAAYKDLARKVERLVIEARQTHQRLQQPEPVYLEPYSFNSNNFANNYYSFPINSFYHQSQHQPFVPSQNFINLENNNRFFNNNQFSPTLSDDNNLPSIFDGGMQLPSINHLDVEQASFNLYNNDDDVIFENVLY